MVLSYFSVEKDEESLELSSDIFEAHGCQWKLLIYPQGFRKEDRDTYVSIYLYLVGSVPSLDITEKAEEAEDEGDGEENKVPEGEEMKTEADEDKKAEAREKPLSCRIRFLISVDAKQKPFKRLYTHEFTLAKRRWGKSRFLALESILDEEAGYLKGEDDSLSFKVTLFEELSAEVSPYEMSSTAQNLSDSSACRAGLGQDIKEENDIVEDDGARKFVGLHNQGATCYLNSLLQMLFITGPFRTSVYSLENTESNIIRSLQAAFHDLQTSERPVSTTMLTKSFGWNDRQSFEMHDVQELNRILCDEIEKKMQSTSVAGKIAEMYSGEIVHYIECVNVEYRSEHKEVFYDLVMDVAGSKGLVDSFKRYTEDEMLEGDNKYDAEGFGKQVAKKGCKLGKVPPILQIVLKRFAYDFTMDTNIKINDEFEFPEFKLDLTEFLAEETKEGESKPVYNLHGVFVHGGGVHGGHYFLFGKPLAGENKWYKFDDEIVARTRGSNAVERNFGGVTKHKARTPTGFEEFTVPRSTNAYMLVYVREDWEESTFTWGGPEEEMSETLRNRIQSDNAEMNMLTLRYATISDLEAYHGDDIFNVELCRELRLPRESRREDVATALTGLLGIPRERAIFLGFARRENKTIRFDETWEDMSELIDFSSPILVQEIPEDKVDNFPPLQTRECFPLVLKQYTPLPIDASTGTPFTFRDLPNKKENDLDGADGESEEQQHALNFYGIVYPTYADTLRYVEELVKPVVGEHVLLFEEVHLRYIDELTDLDMTFDNAEIGSGDIIIFQADTKKLEKKDVETSGKDISEPYPKHMDESTTEPVSDSADETTTESMTEPVENREEGIIIDKSGMGKPGESEDASAEKEFQTASNSSDVIQPSDEREGGGSSSDTEVDASESEVGEMEGNDDSEDDYICQTPIEYFGDLLTAMEMHFGSLERHLAREHLSDYDISCLVKRKSSEVEELELELYPHYKLGKMVQLLAKHLGVDPALLRVFRREDGTEADQIPVDITSSIKLDECSPYRFSRKYRLDDIPEFFFEILDVPFAALMDADAIPVNMGFITVTGDEKLFIRRYLSRNASLLDVWGCIAEEIAAINETIKNEKEKLPHESNSVFMAIIEHSQILKLVSDLGEHNLTEFLNSESVSVSVSAMQLPEDFNAKKHGFWPEFKKGATGHLLAVSHVSDRKRRILSSEGQSYRYDLFFGTPFLFLLKNERAGEMKKRLQSQMNVAKELFDTWEFVINDDEESTVLKSDHVFNVKEFSKGELLCVKHHERRRFKYAADKALSIGDN